MIAERTIQKADDGSVFSDKITLEYTDLDGKKNISFYCDPDGLYLLVHTAIQKMASMGIDAKNPEAAKRNRLSALIKVAIKGMLLMYGQQLLDELFNTKNHPRPAKGDDLLDWYTDMFTKIGISYLMKTETVLSGHVIRESDERNFIGISSVDTRPVSVESNAAVATTE